VKELPITAYRCKQCGKIHYPFHDRCLACLGREFEAINPAGNARLLTYTRIYNLPWGFNERYLTIGIVEFENGVRATGQVKVDEHFPLATGMILKPSWEPVRVQAGENVYGLKFTPVG